jgi:thiol-disulfide isomerase/thioredoxin
MFKIKKNPILNKFLDLEKQYKTNNINDTYDMLNQLRLLQGKVFKKITDISNDTKYNENHKLYKLNLYHSLLEPINSSIENIEKSIVLANGKYMDINDDKKNIPKKENKKKNKYYNINTNNEISLDDILFNSDFESNYNKLDNIQKMIYDMSELTATDTTTPDENTIDILQNNEKTKKNNIKDIIKNIKLDDVELDSEIDSDKNNDDQKLENCKSCIVLFYADWCGWSQKFLPIWNEFKNKIKKLKNLSIITINDSEKPEFAKKFNINGFPTIKFLKGDNAINFDDERTVENLIKFCKKNM